MTKEICGQRQGTPFAEYDHDSRGWKTLQACLPGLTDTSDAFSATWPKWGMMQNGVCSVLPKQVHTTSGKGYGSWFLNMVHRTTVVGRRMWRTPCASEGEHGGRGDLIRDCLGYNGRSPPIEKVIPEGLDGHRWGSLNPDWVAWLMGWPVGWTDLNATPDVEKWERSVMDGTWWATDPADIGVIPRLTGKVPDRANRLKALGNGQVPVQMAMAFSALIDTYNEELLAYRKKHDTPDESTGP